MLTFTHRIDCDVCTYRRTHAQSTQATKTIFTKGVYYEPFELHLYPFDTQPLGVRIQAKKSCVESLAIFVPQETTGTIPRVRDTEWSGTVFNTDSKFVAESAGSDYGHHVLEVRGCR